MLAYRHAFHAGNHADVLKHVALTQVLQRMAAKDKPYTLVDTHAGAGGYSLEGRYARTKAEFEDGIGRLWQRDDLPPAVADYVALVRRFNDGGARLRQYPGSPAIAQMLRRPHDRLRLYELHPTEERILAAYLGAEPDTAVTLGDGFAALKGALPPPSRRGVVLIDPSYEIKTDYARVVAALREALTRFADGTVVVWYPQLLAVESTQLPRRLQGVADAQARRGWLHARLTVQPPDARGYGLVGSGVFVANPPFGLHDSLQSALPFLVDALGRYEGASWLLEQRAE
jgi:23S rRNA (adenine2030-N6)-methyltransferase